MIRRLPLIPTLVVAAAVLVMIALGIWQIGRAGEKEALLARFAAARSQPPVPWPTRPIGDDQLPLFRKASGMCLEPTGKSVAAGRNRNGESGYVHLVDCRTGGMEGPGMRVVIGWSQDPKAGSDWRGGPVSGVIGSDREMRMRLVSAEGLAGLQPAAAPDLAEIPNNHIGYAVTWFAFAGIALLIYGLALRARKTP